MTDSTTRTPDVCECGHQLHPDMTCWEEQSRHEGVITLCSCDVSRPAAAVPVATREPTLEDVGKRIRALERDLQPHREWGYCPMTGNEDCCDTLVNELRLLQRIRATFATSTPSPALLEAATVLAERLDDKKATIRFVNGSVSVAVWFESEAARAEMVATLRALPPSPAPGT